jgi:starch synthase
MRILFVAPEAAPLAKTGGLADVAGSLPRALRPLGYEVAVFLPRYRGIDLSRARRIYDWLPVQLGTRRYDTSIYLVEDEIPYYLLDCPPLYDRPGLYGSADGDFPDNHIRFGVFCRAVFGVVRRVFMPHVLHLHDWQTGLVPVYLKTRFATDPAFIGLKTLFTIHNLGYHGTFPPENMADLDLDASLLGPDLLEFWGRFSFIKGGLVYSDMLNTVSRKYAEEIQTEEYGFGLDGVLRARRNDLFGILNGVDYSHWNPETDRFLAANYSAERLDGKRLCKADLLRTMRLPEEALDRPLFGVVSRLAAQKGAELIASLGSELEAQDAYLVCLGSGDAIYERALEDLASRHPRRAAVLIGFSQPLSHKIEAGCDALLMPSRYEPCGLNQIYSLRYGTVPVVRATGGLDDTIKEDTGFKFQEYSEAALKDAVRAACAAYQDRERWTAMMRRGMQQDFSWNVSAAEYAALYRQLRRGLNPAPAEPALILRRH